MIVISADEIGTEALTVNTSISRLVPKKLKMFKTWYPYEIITFLRVYYYLRVISGLKRNKEFWSRLVNWIADLGVFKTKECCTQFVSKRWIKALHFLDVNQIVMCVYFAVCTV